MTITTAATAMLTDTGITQSHFCVVVAGVRVDSGDSVTEEEYSWIIPTTICSKENFSLAVSCINTKKRKKVPPLIVDVVTTTISISLGPSVEAIQWPPLNRLVIKAQDRSL